MSIIKRGQPMRPIPREFFGMHTNKVGFAPNPTPNHNLGFGSVRLHDAFVYWKQIETTDGVYDWSRLDTLIAAHAGREIMYTMGQCPDWSNGQTTGYYDFGPVPATNPQDFTDFMTVLAIRNRDVYNGAIKAWEFWNEPDNIKLWTGTTQGLIDFVNPAITAIKAIDPNAIIVGPGFLASGWAWFHEFASLGGLALCDKAGYHAYPSPSQPERTEVYAGRVLASMKVLGINKPLWNTEFGYIGYIRDGVEYDNFDYREDEYAALVMPGDLAAAYTVRAYLSAAECGLERSFWYSMDAPIMIIQLCDKFDETQLLPASTAYTHMANLLSDGGLGPRQTSGELYSMAFVAGDGRRGVIYWTRDQRTATVDLSGFASGVDVLGAPITLTSSYSVTESPVYCFR